jgi:hypothetical protein
MVTFFVLEEDECCVLVTDVVVVVVVVLVVVVVIVGEAVGAGDDVGEGSGVPVGAGWCEVGLCLLVGWVVDAEAGAVGSGIGEEEGSGGILLHVSMGPVRGQRKECEVRVKGKECRYDAD